MGTKKTSTAAAAVAGDDINRATHLFEEIATAANNLDKMFYKRMNAWTGLDDSGEFDEHQFAELDQVRKAIQTIGWMADNGTTKLGGSEIRGDAEAWLMSPVYQAIGEKEASHG
jgi:hypothetical protein